MVDSLLPIVVGHFSVDGSLKDDHFNFKNTNNVIVVDEESTGTPEALLLELIKMFSFSGQTIIDITTGEL